MQQDTHPPVAIGGLGGSGTRVFAELLQHAGLTFSRLSNAALDDLWFTVLFKRADWAGQHPPQAERLQAAKLYLRARTEGLKDTHSAEDAVLLDRLANDLPPAGTWRNGASKRMATALARTGRPRPRPWGWKEPNTHVFLPDLDAVIPDLRYIHIARDGLDMAFSKNTTQMELWSSFLGVPAAPEDSIPQRQLRFWIAANKRALAYGRQQMKDRFMLIRYDAFCADPHAHWPNILQFIGAAPDLEMPKDLVRPTSIGRGEWGDLSVIAPDVLAAARRLQSELEKCDVLA